MMECVELCECAICALPKLALLRYIGFILLLFVFEILLAFGQMNSEQQHTAHSIS